MKALTTHINKAVKTIRKQEITQTKTVTKDKTTTYYFTVSDHEVYLEITKKNNCYYQKKWSCTCHHSSSVGMKYNLECYHILAVQTWMVINKLKRTNK